MRSFLAASLLTAVLVGCGTFANVGEDQEGCDLKPLGSPAAGLRLGVPKAAALCAAQVEVEGRTYWVGGGAWLDEDALVLEEYGTISRANGTVYDPTVYALEGVDPRQLLITRNDPSVPWQEGTGVGNFWTLTAELDEPVAFPWDGCRYADPTYPGYPASSCPLTTGRTYSVNLSFRCGVDVPQGPYGGEYWSVVDPPPGLASGPGYRGKYGGYEDGQFELLDADHAVFRGELAGELELRRIGHAAPPDPPCEPQASTAP